MGPHLLFVEDDDATAYLTLKALTISVFPAEIVRTTMAQRRCNTCFQKL